MANLNAIYNVLRGEAEHRDTIVQQIVRTVNFVGEGKLNWTPEELESNKADMIRVHNAINHTVNNLCEEYRAKGGKRDVERFLTADR